MYLTILKLFFLWNHKFKCLRHDVNIVKQLVPTVNCTYLQTWVVVYALSRHSRTLFDGELKGWDAEGRSESDTFSGLLAPAKRISGWTPTRGSDVRMCNIITARVCSKYYAIAQRCTYIVTSERVKCTEMSVTVRPI